VEISVVVPAFNERESVGELASLLRDELNELGRTWEIIFVDDGSSDGTLEELRRLNKTIPGVRMLSMRRNFGKSAALSVGFEEAKGELIVTLDADLQDDPGEIRNLVAKLDEGYDMISGWKHKRRDPWTKTVPSKIFRGQRLFRPRSSILCWRSCRASRSMTSIAASRFTGAKLWRRSTYTVSSTDSFRCWPIGRVSGSGNYAFSITPGSMERRSSGWNGF
jgi:glycosyltransferase involved in cell wall biosynthesis